MKIVPKLTLALVAGMCSILAANAFLRVRREIAFFEADRVRDHEMIGRSLGAAVAAVWKSEGKARALDTLQAVNSHFTRIGIRWLDANARARLDDAKDAPAGRPLTRVTRVANGDVLLTTYVELDLADAKDGAIELSEPATTERRFVHEVVVDTIATTGALACLSALLAFLMGQWLVGRPIKALSEKARRVGNGDFTGPLTLSAKDELGDLAREVNGMCDRLTTTLEQLRHADRLVTVGKLAAGVAHELGTPLNVVVARAKMIADGETTPDEGAAYARIIGGAADRMTKIIRQLLQFARRARAEKARIDLREVAGDVLELLRPLAAKRGVQLSLEASGDAVINADKGQLEQVLTNLVMNAAQASKSGDDVHVNVRLETARPPEPGAQATSCVCFSVKDVGVGIAKEHLEHLFEPFFTTKEVGEGTGLGLAVSYGIVREHGGWLDVQSSVGAGSVFTVYLPRSRAQ